MSGQRSAAVFFVGNKLKLDDGIGPAAYDAFCAKYEVGSNVELFDVGCLSLDMIRYVEKCDFVLTVDAVDGSGHPAGTVFRYAPDDMARTSGPRDSLHDLKLADLFDAAMLLGYECEGWCVGMQVENMSPAEFVIGLTEPCAAALPLLVDAAAAELDRRGFAVTPPLTAAEPTVVAPLSPPAELDRHAAALPLLVDAAAELDRCGFSAALS